MTAITIIALLIKAAILGAFLIAALVILAPILCPRQAYKPRYRTNFDATPLLQIYRQTCSANHPLDWECPFCHSPEGQVCREGGAPVPEGYCHIDRQQLVTWRN